MLDNDFVFPLDAWNCRSQFGTMKEAKLKKDTTRGRVGSWKKTGSLITTLSFWNHPTSILLVMGDNVL